MIIKCIFFTFLTLGPLMAQKVIVRDDITDPEELKKFDTRLAKFNQEQEVKKALYIQSARIATQKLSDEILKGNVEFAMESLYGRWKKKLAVRFGGEEQLLRGLKKAADTMVRDNIVITDITVGVPDPKAFYYVWMQKKKGMGVVVFPFDYTFQKLVFVPVDMKIKLEKIDPKTQKNMTLSRQTFQVAIYDELVKKWSFISGDTIKVNELRGLFPTLPLDVKKHYIKAGKVED